MSGFNFRYTGTQLTTRVNRVPNTYGRINELGIFGADRGSASTNVEVPMSAFSSAILANAPRGGDIPFLSNSNQGSIVIPAPYLPLGAAIGPGDIQNQIVLDQATGPRPKTLSDALAEKMMQLKLSHAMSLEYLRMQALKGKLIDGKNKMLHDLHAIFGFQKVTVYFDLENPNVNVKEKTKQLARLIEVELRGETMTGVHAFVSPEFFDLLEEHPSVNKYFLNQMAATGKGTEDLRKGFRFGSMVFEEYNAVAPGIDGKSYRFVEEGLGHAFPLGTTNSFQNHFAPPHQISGANMPGMQLYISPHILPHNEGVELKSESSPLPLCVRPELLIELSADAPPAGP
mgnify:CR=1 FL=1